MADDLHQGVGGVNLDAKSELLPLSTLDVLEAQLGSSSTDPSKAALAALQDACDALAGRP